MLHISLVNAIFVSDIDEQSFPCQIQVLEILPAVLTLNNPAILFLIILLISKKLVQFHFITW